ncbi:MAG TPA: MarR family transcriptional regulator [Microbacteriaceae bacterium]
MESVDLIGTRLRQVLDLLDDGIAETYADLGVPGFRPRYTPILVALHESGPLTIKNLATAVNVTHSAMSQTVGLLIRDGLAVGSVATDGRARLISLSEEGTSIMPLLITEWNATAHASRQLDSELTQPLSKTLDEVVNLLSRRSFAERLYDARAADGPKSSTD